MIMMMKIVLDPRECDVLEFCHKISIKKSNRMIPTSKIFFNFQKCRFLHDSNKKNTVEEQNAPSDYIFLPLYRLLNCDFDRFQVFNEC